MFWHFFSLYDTMEESLIGTLNLYSQWWEKSDWTGYKELGMLLAFQFTRLFALDKMFISLANLGISVYFYLINFLGLFAYSNIP